MLGTPEMQEFQSKILNNNNIVIGKGYYIRYNIKNAYRYKRLFIRKNIVLKDIWRKVTKVYQVIDDDTEEVLFYLPPNKGFKMDMEVRKFYLQVKSPVNIKIKVAWDTINTSPYVSKYYHRLNANNKQSNFIIFGITE